MTTGVSVRSENRSVVVIGLGNPFRRDDGIGPALVAALEPQLLPYVTVVTATRDPAVLLEAWADTDLAVVVDGALCQPSTPGRIHRYTSHPRTGAPVAGNSHGFSVSEAIRLATVLNRAPQRLVLFAVEAADISVGQGLSPAVEATVPMLAEAVLHEIGASAPVLPRQAPNRIGSGRVGSLVVPHRT
jgi:hydrogenase maturation protease